MKEGRNILEGGDARKHGKGAAASNEPPPGDNSLRCKYCNAELDCSNALRGHEKLHEEEIEGRLVASSTPLLLHPYSQFTQQGASSSSSRSPRNQAYGVSRLSSSIHDTE